MTPDSPPTPPGPGAPCAEGPNAAVHAVGFNDRAQQMVAFLAEQDAQRHPPAHAPEQALAEWISRWRGMPRRGLDATQHFVADELGIIARALNGPTERRRLRPERTDQLCWLIARCISRAP